jgi:hypothetical protein
MLTAVALLHLIFLKDYEIKHASLTASDTPET